MEVIKSSLINEILEGGEERISERTKSFPKGGVERWTSL